MGTFMFGGIHHSSKAKWRIAVVGSLLLLLTIFAFWPFRFCYDSICSQCGAIQHTTEWQLPHSKYSFYIYSTIEATPLSRYLETSNLIAKHSHSWLFEHGGGNGVRCALGDGDSIRASVMSPEVVRLLELVREYGEQAEREKLLRYALDRNIYISRSILSLAMSVPANGFSSKAEYKAWISDHSFLIDDALEAAKKNK
jgi:hypothetical protein